MAHNLKKFNSEADYNAATLNYPAVSWVTGTDAVHFDKTAPATNDKVMMAWHTDSDTVGSDIVLWNGGASTQPDALFDYLTLNDDNLLSTIGADGTLHYASIPNETYVAKYGLLDDSEITDIFSGDLGGGWGSLQGNVEFFIPSSVTEIASLPGNANKVVIDNETVPTMSIDWSGMNSTDLYVPDSAVSAYQTAIGVYWSGSINGLSDYSGNLPI